MGRPSKVTVEDFTALEAVSHFVNKNRSTTLETIVVSLESRVKDLTPENRGVFVSKITEAIGTLEESGKIVETDSGITFVPNPKGRPKGSKNAPKLDPTPIVEHEHIENAEHDSDESLQHQKTSQDQFDAEATQMESSQG